MRLLQWVRSKLHQLGMAVMSQKIKGDGCDLEFLATLTKGVGLLGLEKGIEMGRGLLWGGGTLIPSVLYIPQCVDHTAQLCCVCSQNPHHHPVP